jgi:hypothetical protein
MASARSNPVGRANAMQSSRSSAASWRQMGRVPEARGCDVQLIGAEELQAGTADARDCPVALQLAQDAPSHLSARPHQSGKVCPGQNGGLAEEKVAMLRQDPKDAEPRVLVEEAVDPLDHLVHRPGHRSRRARGPDRPR